MSYLYAVRPRTPAGARRTGLTVAALGLWIVAGVAQAQPLGYAGSGSVNTPWTDYQCGGCHEPDPLYSHPVQVRATISIPDHLPLKNGRITCVTCHDDSDPEAHAQARNGNGSLLRYAPVDDGFKRLVDGEDQTEPLGEDEPMVVFASYTRGPEPIDPKWAGIRFEVATHTPEEGDFCTQCHDPQGMTRQAAHGSSLGLAHLDWPDKDGPAAASEDRSDQCLTCHDGSVGRDVSFGAASMGAGRTGSATHPVGVRYRASGGRRSAALRSPASLDRAIRLFSGRVGCGSCHNLYGRREKLLVMSNDHSDLCLSCHDL